MKLKELKITRFYAYATLRVVNASLQTSHRATSVAVIVNELSKRVRRCISMCHATQKKRWSHNTRCHTTCVFSLSGSLLQSLWTLLTCVPFQFYIEHTAAHANISKVTLLYHLTLEASFCCPLLGTFTTVLVSSLSSIYRYGSPITWICSCIGE